MNLPEALQAAKELSQAGQEKLRQAILSQFGPQEVVVRELSPAEREAAERAARLAEAAKAEENARAVREDQSVGQIIAVLVESDPSAIRAVNEIVGVAPKVAKKKGGKDD